MAAPNAGKGDVALANRRARRSFLGDFVLPIAFALAPIVAALTGTLLLCRHHAIARRRDSMLLSEATRRAQSEQHEEA